MGGKSSYVRTSALLILLSQIGSYIPADSLHLTPFESILTRIGASDNLFTASSTFHHELSSTSEILKRANKRSLVIIDELGRGTSTHDGVAIAEAVAEYLVREVGCLGLFITHYQSLGVLEKAFPGGEVKNVHMRFESHKIGDDDGGGNGREEITFLYEIGEGVAHRSYGLNVARLAKIPSKVLEVAGKKSQELEDEVRGKKMSGLANLFRNLLLLPSGETGSDTIVSQELDQLVTGIEQL